MNHEWASHAPACQPRKASSYLDHTINETRARTKYHWKFFINNISWFTNSFCWLQNIMTQRQLCIHTCLYRFRLLLKSQKWPPSPNALKFTTCPPYPLSHLSTYTITAKQRGGQGTSHFSDIPKNYFLLNTYNHPLITDTSKQHPLYLHLNMNLCSLWSKSWKTPNWIGGAAYASAGMLQLRLSLSRQSNPSTLTAGLFPKLARTHPPLRVEEGDARGEAGASPKRASWISGLDTLLGGDPEKNGGDEATAWSLPKPPCCCKFNTMILFND